VQWPGFANEENLSLEIHNWAILRECQNLIDDRFCSHSASRPLVVSLPHKVPMCEGLPLPSRTRTVSSTSDLIFIWHPRVRSRAKTVME